MHPRDRLERSQWDFFWIPDDAEVLDTPELGAVRCPRPIPHLNMVTRTRVKDADVTSAVERAGGWLGATNARWFVPDTFDRAALMDALDHAGWARAGEYEARVLPTSASLGDASSDLEVRRVDSIDALRACRDVMHRAFGRELRSTDEEDRAELAQCADPGGRVHRFVVHHRGEPICSGGFNVFVELGFAFLWAGGTVPEARGRGAYRALLRARLEAARDLGVEWAGLYAKTDTSAPIVASLGFEHVGAMTIFSRGETG
ncbi:MAG: hypothetical protein AB7S26_37425 [Sandaracinaceae bacterium]